MKQRPIEFRVWDKYKKQFILNSAFDNLPKDCTVDISVKMSHDFQSIGSIISKFHEENEDSYCPYFIFQQFTGILDKNGKKIFEGDLVKDTKNSSIIKQIVYHKLGFVAQHSTYQMWRDIIYSDTYEVIGNICQNPELINK